MTPQELREEFEKEKEGFVAIVEDPNIPYGKSTEYWLGTQDYVEWLETQFISLIGKAESIIHKLERVRRELNS